MSGSRDRAASAAQYILLGGFAAVASGISSQGLTGFARSNMALPGPWPYLLFFALDGAAGVCAVLLARRAARAEASMAPRLAVWGLVAASAAFNAAHAPRRPGAPEAYALMPVIAAVLFEFCLQETRSRRTGRPDRRLSALHWLHPAERIRIRLRMAADETLSAREATRRVRTESAARSLYRLRTAQHPQERAGAENPVATRRARRALRRAHAALTRAGFADAAVAAEVLRHVQMLTMTAALAALDYTSAEASHAAIGAMITPRDAHASGQASPSAQPAEAGGSGARVASCPCPAAARTGTDSVGDQRLLVPTADAPAAAGSPVPEWRPAVRQSPPGRDDQLIEAARRAAGDAAGEGARLSQAALARKLRGEGWTIANGRLRWLAEAAGLGSHHG